ncbi:MAG: hypothetical protein AB8U15_04585 [Rickettsiales endosymbiont of Dermacentor nuttalli]
MYEERRNLIQEYYNAHLESVKNVVGDMVYNAISPEFMWLNQRHLESKLLEKVLIRFDQFLHTDNDNVLILAINKIPNFLLQAKLEEKPVYDILHLYIKTFQLSGKKVIICCMTEGSRQRIVHILFSNNINNSQYRILKPSRKIRCEFSRPCCM